MISNQTSIPANMGNLFQIFNLPKTGGSSYLFSDIIKVIGNEADTLNAMTEVPPVLNGQEVITSSKLLSLISDNLNSGAKLTEKGILNEKLLISEEELSGFMEKLGLGNISPESKEVVIELSPEVINKLKNLVSGIKKEKVTSSFITLEQEGNKPNNNKTSEMPSVKEGKTKIKVVFKKVEPETLTQPLQQFANTSVWQNNIMLNDEPVQINLTQKSDSLPENIPAGTSSSYAGIITDEESSNTLAAASGQTGAITNKVAAGDQTLSTEIQNPGSSNTVTTAGEKNVTAKTINSAPVETVNEIIPEAVNQVNPKVVNQVKPEADNDSDAPVLTLTEPKTEFEKIIKDAVVSASKDKSPEVKNDAKKHVQKTVNEHSSAQSSDSKTSDSTSHAASKNKSGVSPEKNIAGETVKASGINVAGSKDKNETTNVKTTVKPGTSKKEPPNIAKSTGQVQGEVKIDKKDELVSGKTQEKSYPQESKIPVSDNPEDEDRKVFEGGFLENKRYRKTFGNMFQDNKIEVKQDHQKAAPEQNSVYEISFEGNETGAREKILPHDFTTTDYEEFTKEVFTSKNNQNIKETASELKQENNPVNPEKIQPSSENENTSSDSLLDNAPKNSVAHEVKSNLKPSGETPFADHLGTRNNIANENVQSKHEVPSYKDNTSLFKNINASELIDEVKNLVVRGEKTNITLKLSPEHLGSVKLTIDIKDSIMNTNIEVENESVRQTVQNNIESLKQTLQQNGIQLQSFSISLSQHEQKTPGKPFVKKKAQQENDEISIKDEVKASSAKKMGYNTYEYLA